MAAPRFHRSTLDDVLGEVCERLDLDPAGARLLKFTNNAVYALASAPVVVRIVGSHALRHRAAKVVRVGHHLAEHDVPATRLHADQPIVAGDHVATVWDLVAETGPEPTAADLARLLRRMHAVPLPDGLPNWDPLADVRARVADAEELSDADRAFLLERCAEIGEELPAFEWPVTALLHGDAHLGNVLAGADGGVLCDFDSSCIGPAVWDLVPFAVGVLRFGCPAAEYRSLADVYGVDVMALEQFPVLQAARDLKLTTSALPILRSNPAVRPELYRRLRDLQAGRREVVWQRYR